ncbi:nitroreductase/quinone reductase family protein [Cellulomonas fengjieae]|uniref:Nitroreductase family deazaflavin-dependent oxidoreductase n=1 Tax=Cellulomonas fengjieae TaxID=2819978 RepID=A0ABS3SKI1_9CELL|nr:nitroreductase/quinone reductase family protein [Cellulomonas fengjieae]MBO3086245.1 nitroreductase family deazaflavin-dependent oxidoreductase [Cellulomonas fengjieae]MBO3102349.1 nitroreductase family deazaflavin-dependent oxidoreductase [Cellulomonas fengjieae]QVI65709.1 nitroreductase family deazaflavin-dependent oxidoreductase [Cellulomonas fengjieae]
MTSTALMRTLSWFHRAAVTLSRGRVGGTLVGLPSLELITVGRRSGRLRTSMLTAPLTLGDTLVIVASAGGNDQHPAWFLNLRDDPHVRVSVGGARAVDMLARVATPEEREELWPRIVAALPNYARYQERTSRVIPVVLLEPV